MFHRAKIEIVLWMSVTSFLALLSFDGYLSSISAITKEFSISEQHFYLTVNVFFIAFGISQLFYGIIYDIYRKKKGLLIIGYTIFLLGSMISMISPSINTLLLGRFIQGVGLGSSGMLRFVMLTDNFRKTSLSQALSWTNILFMSMQPLVVLLWVYIQTFWGWRYNFAFTSFSIIICILIFSFFYSDTMTAEQQKKQFDLTTFLKTYFSFFKAKTILNIINVSLIKSVSFICVALIPLVLQNIFKLSAIEYGWFNLINIATIIIGGLINVFFVKKYGVKKMLVTGVLLISLSSVTILTFGCLKIFTITAIFIPILFILLGGKIAYNNALILVLDSFSKTVGTMSAVYNGIETFICSLFGLCVLTVSSGNIQISLGILVFSLSLIILSCLYYSCKIGNAPC